MFSRLAIAMALTFTSLLTACGPEKSTEELMGDERDRQEKVSRERLVDRAERIRPNIDRWQGCYLGKYYFEGERKVYVRMEKWLQLVTPGEGSDLDPVEMPVLRAFIRSTEARGGNFRVTFNRFDANADATYIQFSSAGSATGATAVMEFVMDASGRHEGFYRGPAMGQASPMSLVPEKAARCAVGS